MTAPLVAQSGSVAPAANWIEVETTSGRAHLDSLDDEEAAEQLRDWALLAAYTSVAPDKTPHREALIGVPLVREDSIVALYSRRAGETRSLALPDGRVIVLVPATASPERRRLQIGRLLDEQRSVKGRIPAVVIPYEYRVSFAPHAIAIHALTSAAGDDFFRESAGYYERTVGTVADLDAFLSLNTDLTHVRLENRRLVIGGRTFGAKLAPMVTREDLAALKQAEAQVADEVRAQLRKRGLRAEYDARNRERAAAALARIDATSGVASYTEMLAAIKRLEVNEPYEQYEAEYIDAIMAENPPSLGFSLDPRINRGEIAADMERLARGDFALLDGWYRGETMRLFKQGYVLSARKRQEKLERLFSALRDSSPEVRPPAEEDIRTLIGLAESPAPAVPSVSSAPDITLSVDSVPDLDVSDDVDEFIATTQASIVSWASEMRRVAADLRQDRDDSLLDLQRYLNADAIGLTMRPGAAAYRVHDLQQMLHDTTDDTLVVDGVYGAKTTATVRQFQEDHGLSVTGLINDETWKQLLDLNEGVADRLETLRDLLNALEVKNNFQCARYDGRLAGTRVGMTMFYTDLLMKLWGFAGREETPPVPGFVSKTQFNLSPIYWDNQRRFPSTRMWLGPLPEGVGVRDGGAIAFAPVATRLYNASSNPLINGKEVPATFSAERFSAWWNAHYLDVAEHEPQYHRLNQIMKWQFVLASYEDDALPVFEGLSSIPVTRNLRFDEWWKANRAALREAPLDAFRSMAGEPTECLGILQSKLYLSMDGIYQYSGGVKMWDRTLVRAKRTAPPRPDIPATIRVPGIDAAKAIVEPKGIIRAPLTEGGSERAMLALMGDSRTAEWRPTVEAVLQGKARSLSAERVELAYEGGLGAVRVSGRAGREPIFDLSVHTADTGRRVVVDMSDGPLLAAIRDVQAFESRGTPLDPSRYIRIRESSQLLVREANDTWALLSPAKSVPKDASGGASIRFAVGSEPMVARSVSRAELDQLTSPFAVERLTSSYDARPLSTELVRSVPDDARAIRLHVDDVEVRGRLSDGDLYVTRSGALGGGARPVAEAMSSGEFDRLLVALDDAPVAAMRGHDGKLLVASIGDEVSLSQRRALEAVLTAERKGVTAILGADDRLGVMVDELGTLRLPRIVREEDVVVATRTAQLLSDDPALSSAFTRVGAIDSRTLDVLSAMPAVRRAAYLEFRAAPPLLKGEMLADLRITPDAPSVMVRRGTDVEFLPFNSRVKPDQLAREYQYVDDVMNPERARLEGRTAPDPTMDELRANTRGIYTHLSELASATKTERIVTLESGDINNATIWALHRGDPRIHFFRDQADLHASVGNVRRPVAMRAARSVFAITADPNGAGSPGRVPALADQVAQRMPIAADTSFDAFVELLHDERVTQLVLVAREQNGGLAFSDRWVSLAELELVLIDVPQKPMLVVVSNGGAEVQKTFSDSGRFARVLSLKFVLGQIDTFEAALDSVGHLFEPIDTNAIVDSHAFDAALARAGTLAGALVSAATPENGSVRVDLAAFFKRAGRLSARVSTEEAVVLDIQRQLADSARSARGVDVDETIERMTVERVVRPQASGPARKARAEFSAIVQAKFD